MTPIIETYAEKVLVGADERRMVREAKLHMNRIDRYMKVGGVVVGTGVALVVGNDVRKHYLNDNSDQED